MRLIQGRTRQPIIHTDHTWVYRNEVTIISGRIKTLTRLTGQMGGHFIVGFGTGIIDTGMGGNGFANRQAAEIQSIDSLPHSRSFFAPK